MTEGPHPLLSSERFDWQTPAWFLDLVRAVAPIGFDPCTAASNPTGARLFAVQEVEQLDDGSGFFVSSCGLSDAWPILDGDELVFANPPYGAQLSGDVDPDTEHTKRGKLIGRGSGWGKRIAEYDGGTVIALVPSRTDAEWWGRLWHASDVIVFWKSPERGARISFVDPLTGEPVDGSNIASCVFLRSTNPTHVARFVEAFGAHGITIKKARS